MYQDFHSEHQVAAKLILTVGNLEAEITVISHYSQPGKQKYCDSKLKILVKAIQMDQDEKHIIILADLNRDNE